MKSNIGKSASAQAVDMTQHPEEKGNTDTCYIHFQCGKVEQGFSTIPVHSLLHFSFCPVAHFSDKSP